MQEAYQCQLSADANCCLSSAMSLFTQLIQSENKKCTPSKSSLKDEFFFRLKNGKVMTQNIFECFRYKDRKKNG